MSSQESAEQPPSSSQQQRKNSARMAMATPAILLFAVTCLAQMIAGVRSSGGGRDNGNNGDGDYGDYGVHPSTAVRGGGAAAAGGGGVVVLDGVLDDASISLERHHHHHGHHYGGGRSDSSQGNTDGDGATNNNNRDDSFDSYVYSMSYQPEFCRENGGKKFDGCKDFVEMWEGQLTIHGLWPNRDDGTWPSGCTDERLDVSLLEDLSDELAVRWPNVKAPSAASSGHASFWSHEWSKHGTCSGLGQHEYFSSALGLLVETPSVVKENYGRTVTREELEEGYGGGGGNGDDGDGDANRNKPIFVCKYGYLSEVRVCYSKADEGGAVGERVPCSEAAMREDSCADDEIKIASFEDAGSASASKE